MITRFFTLTLAVLVTGPGFPQSPPKFIRGDADITYSLDLNDALTVLGHLFLQEPERLDCEDAADANDDGDVNLTDAISILYYLFDGGLAIPEPNFPCGQDPTEDGIRCESFWVCSTGILENSLGMKLLPVPAGEFQMGSPVTERGREPDEVLHTVVLRCPFYMSATEVTQRQYLKIMGKNPSYFNGFRDGTDWGEDLSRAVDLVSWFQAVEFCQKLSAREGLKYRLPYEAEWEYACRAGTSTRFWFGNALKCSDDDCPRCQEAEPFMFATDDRTAGLLFPVGQKKPNAWGFFDMHDVAIEWCQDWYGPYPQGQTTDPTGPRSGSLKVFRGINSHCVGMKIPRSARRSAAPPALNSSPESGYGIGTGFRVVAEIPACSYGYP